MSDRPISKPPQATPPPLPTLGDEIEPAEIEPAEAAAEPEFAGDHSAGDHTVELSASEYDPASLDLIPDLDDIADAGKVEGQIFGHYRLIKAVGKGGMAEVFLASPTDDFRDARGEMLPPQVALKRVLPHHAEDETFVKMLRDEAQIAVAIDHPHVARVYEQGEAEGLHYIAMEYVDGVDLAGVLRTLKERGKAMSLPAALYVARCVADGLHAAHVQEDEAGEPLHIIHRDVSPHNILVGWDGVVKLIDFGVAKAAHNQSATRSGVIKGKLQYMSPEQAMAKGVDARSDVFSLGLTLYKMLTGRLPFRGRNEFQVYEQILRKQAAPPSKLVPGIPPRVDAIVMRALRKDPSGRFQSAREFSKLLVLALHELSPDFSARELARFLAREAPPKGLVARPQDEDDDLDLSGELSQAASLPASTLNSTIDRLTHLSNGTGSLDLAHGSQPFPPPKRRGMWLWVAGVALLGAGMAGGLWWAESRVVHQAGRGGVVMPPERPILASAPLPKDAGLPLAAVMPVPADAALPEPAEPSPPEIAEPVVFDTVEVGAVVEPSRPSSPGRTLRRRPPKKPQPPVVRSGFLSVNTLPWSWVSVDGKPLKKNTPLLRFPLPAGKHSVMLKTADGRTERKSIVIKPGQVSTLRHTF